MPMMPSQILKSVDFTKTQKSRYLEIKTLFFLQIKKFINYTSRVRVWQKNSFVAEVIFNLSKFVLATQIVRVRNVLSLHILSRTFVRSCPYLYILR